MSKVFLPSRLRQALDLPLLSAAGILSAMLALTGGFGSFAIVLPLRVWYWLLTLIGSGVALFWLRRALGRWIKRPILIGVTTIVAAAMPSALAAGLLAGILGLRTGPGWPAFVVIGCSITPPLYVLWRMLDGRSLARDVAPAVPGNELIPPALAHKLPLRLARSRLIAIEAQDHYLRVITEQGEALVHMRLAEALGALNGTDGLQVHRSWWVATEAVEDVHLARGRGMLRLANNLQVPVSRTFARDAEAKFCG
jgi:hypothetical protein